MLSCLNIGKWVCLIVWMLWMCKLFYVGSLPNWMLKLLCYVGYGINCCVMNKYVIKSRLEINLWWNAYVFVGNYCIDWLE